MRHRWFHPGDIATIEEDGYFFIVDRKKDLMVRGGYDVYASRRRRRRRAAGRRRRAMERIKLRDGSQITVRPIESGDRDAIAEGHRWLSPESRFRPFTASVPE